MRSIHGYIISTYHSPINMLEERVNRETVCSWMSYIWLPWQTIPKSPVLTVTGISFSVSRGFLRLSLDRKTPALWHMMIAMEKGSGHRGPSLLEHEEGTSECSAITPAGQWGEIPACLEEGEVELACVTSHVPLDFMLTKQHLPWHKSSFNALTMCPSWQRGRLPSNSSAIYFLSSHLITLKLFFILVALCLSVTSTVCVWQQV